MFQHVIALDALISTALYACSVHCKDLIQYLKMNLKLNLNWSIVRPSCCCALFISPSAALDWFAMKRFYDDSLGGVTQPSQRRFVKLLLLYSLVEILVTADSPEYSSSKV